MPKSPKREGKKGKFMQPFIHLEIHYTYRMIDSGREYIYKEYPTILKADVESRSAALAKLRRIKAVLKEK